MIPWDQVADGGCNRVFLIVIDNPRRESFNDAMLSGLQVGLETGAEDVNLIDLGADGINPVFFKAE